jgi:hypothetical protein
MSLSPTCAPHAPQTRAILEHPPGYQVRLVLNDPSLGQRRIEHSASEVFDLLTRGHFASNHSELLNKDAKVVTPNRWQRQFV